MTGCSQTGSVPQIAAESQGNSLIQATPCFNGASTCSVWEHDMGQVPLNDDVQQGAVKGNENINTCQSCSLVQKNIWLKGPVPHHVKICARLCIPEAVLFHGFRLVQMPGLHRQRLQKPYRCPLVNPRPTNRREAVQMASPLF